MERNMYFFYPKLKQSSPNFDRQLALASQLLMLDAMDKKHAAQIAQIVVDYLNDCHIAFLTSERVRHLLLFGLLLVAIIALISVTFIPLATISISLMALLALTLFVTNITMTFMQSHHPQPSQDWDRLATLCASSESQHRCEKANLHRLSSTPESSTEQTPLEEQQQFKPLFTPISSDKLAAINEDSHQDKADTDDLARLSR
jgi:hypothetical protein